jgi:hypothetical protein
MQANKVFYAQIIVLLLTLTLGCSSRVAELEQSPVPPEEAGEPRLSIEPFSGPLGTEYTIVLEFFKPGEVVDVRLTFVETGEEILRLSETMDETGSGMIRVRSDPGNAGGLYLVVAEGRDGSTAQGEFEIEITEEAVQATAAAQATATAQVQDSDEDGVPNYLDQCDGQIPGASGADETGCPTHFDPYAGLSFDHDKHRAWYGRFWTGSCEGLSTGLFSPDGCFGGRPYWDDTLAQALEGVPPQDQGRLRNRLWALGRMIGHEWARDNDVRRIDSNDVEAWGNLLKTSSDLEATIDLIEAEADEKLAG